MWGAYSLQLNNVHVEQQKKLLAPYSPKTGFNCSTKNRVIQLEWKTLYESKSNKKTRASIGEYENARRNEKQICGRKKELF